MGQKMARAFLARLVEILRVVAPVIAFLMVVIASLGIVVAYIEGWTIGDGIYFAFVTALTIGYGDLTAKRALGRIVAVAIGFTGIIFTGVMVAVAVVSLRTVVIELHGDVEKLRVEDTSYGILTQTRESRKAKKQK